MNLLWFKPRADRRRILPAVEHSHDDGHVAAQVIVDRKRKPLGQRAMKSADGFRMQSGEQPQLLEIASETVKKIRSEPVTLRFVKPVARLQIALGRMAGC